ncbi:MAG: hypothetical protein ACPG06_06885 [Alphaproteobacteria bacterium]
MYKSTLTIPALTLALSLAFALPAIAGQDEDCDAPKGNKAYSGQSASPKAIEERKKCFSSHFKANTRSSPKERVMRPAYAAGKSKPAPKSAAADMYIKIGDIKGEAD